MSPRKSSTSSGKPRVRSRYFGVEVAGEPLLSLSPRAWEELLHARLASSGPAVPGFRVVRADGRRAVVRVDHREAARARRGWNGRADSPEPVLATVRTWGTLVKAKRWLRRNGPGTDPSRRRRPGRRER